MQYSFPTVTNNDILYLISWAITGSQGDHTHLQNNCTSNCASQSQVQLGLYNCLILLNWMKMVCASIIILIM